MAVMWAKIKVRMLRDLAVWGTLNVKPSVRLMKENKNFTLVSSFPSIEILILSKHSRFTWLSCILFSYYPALAPTLA